MYLLGEIHAFGARGYSWLLRDAQAVRDERRGSMARGCGRPAATLCKVWPLACPGRRRTKLPSAGRGRRRHLAGPSGRLKAREVRAGMRRVLPSTPRSRRAWAGDLCARSCGKALSASTPQEPGATQGAWWAGWSVCPLGTLRRCTGSEGSRRLFRFPRNRKKGRRIPVRVAERATRPNSHACCRERKDRTRAVWKRNIPLCLAEAVTTVSPFPCLNGDFFLIRQGLSDVNLACSRWVCCAG